MTTQRSPFPPTRADKLADYYELIGFGECHEQAAKRAGFTTDEAGKLITAEKEKHAQRARRERKEVA